MLLVNSFFFQNILTSCFLPKSVILCGYETVSLILKEKSRCKVYGNTVQNIWMGNMESIMQLCKVPFSFDVTGMIRLAGWCGTCVEDEKCTLDLCHTI